MPRTELRAPSVLDVQPPLSVTCQHVHAQLDAYLDGALPDGAAAPIREHLAACAACARTAALGEAYHRRLRRVREAGAAERPAPSSLRLRVTRLLDADAPAAREPEPAGD